jgi:hypothetical protein
MLRSAVALLNFSNLGEDIKQVKLTSVFRYRKRWRRTCKERETRDTQRDQDPVAKRSPTLQVKGQNGISRRCTIAFLSPSWVPFTDVKYAIALGERLQTSKEYQSKKKTRLPTDVPLADVGPGQCRFRQTMKICYHPLRNCR